MELIETKDLFENDELVIIESTYQIDDRKIINTDIAIKNPSDDIVSIITLNSKEL